MADGNESLTELQREAEASRADLMHTVDSLQSRVSPRALKEDIKEYVRDTGNSLLFNVERRIRDNPLQSAAIAAGLAFPLWRLLSSVPAPIALIGAGIALSQRGGNGGRGGAPHAANASKGPDISDVMSQAADKIGERVSAAADIASEKLGALKAQTAHAVDDAVHKVQDLASDSAATVSDAVSQAYNSSKEMAEKATHEVELAFDRTKDRLVHAVEEHPLVVGGVGLLIGAFVASCIPTTSAEASAFGEVSADLKGRALGAVNKGIDVVKTAAGDVYDNAVEQTTKRGFTADVLDDVLHETGGKVQSAAHDAIDRMGAKPQITN